MMGKNELLEFRIEAIHLLSAEARFLSARVGMITLTSEGGNREFFSASGVDCSETILGQCLS